MRTALPDQASTSEIVAGPDWGEARVDRFLAESGLKLSRSRVKGLIEAGLVFRDGSAIALPSERVVVGALYRIELPAPVAAVPEAQAIPLRILFEDRHLLVLDKQAGLVTHPAPGNEDGTLVNALLAYCGAELPGIGGERRPGIVHRLDKDTSGVMVVAKTEAALGSLSADFAARRQERAYLALAWGVPQPAHGRWQGDIGRDPRDRKRMAVVTRGGKPAATRYGLLATVGTSLGLLRLRLESGRTHQIRVHASAAGHPLVGDPVYLRRIPAAAKGLGAAARGAALDFPRQALHAWTLGFRHPASGRLLRFVAAPPPDLEALFAACGLEMPLPEASGTAAESGEA